MEDAVMKKQPSYSDRRVMKGAEILRRQIVEGLFQDDEQVMMMHQRGASSAPYDYEDATKGSIPIYRADDDSDWSDPMPPPRQLAPQERQESERHAEGYISDPSDDEDDDGENTAQLLARARQLSLSNEVASPRIGTRPNPFVEARLDERENTDIHDGQSTSWSPLFPNFQCGAFEQGMLQKAAQALKGSTKEFCSSAEPKIKGNVMSPRTALTGDSWDLLQDLQKQEAELFPPAKTTAVEKSQLNTPPPKQREQPPASPPELSFVAPPRDIQGPDPSEFIVAPSSAAFFRLMQDEGYRHALHAGTLWQSIISQHVRFPETWWNGSRSPPMGVGVSQSWTFLGRHRVRSNPSLRDLVPTRNDAGRFLLHIIVRDIMSGEAILDIAIGAFHPNARGVRTTPAADPSLGSCRDIWIALRPRVDDETPIETLLLKSGQPDQSPLGSKRAIDNSNLRSVFGERPPVNTVFVLESELYEVLVHRQEQPASAALLERYYDKW